MAFDKFEIMKVEELIRNATKPLRDDLDKLRKDYQELWQHARKMNQITGTQAYSVAQLTGIVEKLAGIPQEGLTLQERIAADWFNGLSETMKVSVIQNASVGITEFRSTKPEDLSRDQITALYERALSLNLVY